MCVITASGAAMRRGSLQDRAAAQTKVCCLSLNGNSLWVLDVEVWKVRSCVDVLTELTRRRSGPSSLLRLTNLARFLGEAHEIQA